MKILVTGDWHGDDRNPENRLGSYEDDFFKKIIQIREICKDWAIDFVLQPGDMFNRTGVSDQFIASFIWKLQGFPQIYSVPGQHDMRYHSSNISNTPYNIMLSTGLVDLLGVDPYILGGVHIYGSRWGDAIPKVRATNVINILVIHETILERDAPFEGVQADDLLARYQNYDYIISGDNHKTFVSTRLIHGDRQNVLINCGSLMRSSIDQISHKPVVYVINTKNDLQIHPIYLDILPPEEVLNLDKTAAIKERKDEIEQFTAYITSLSKGKKIDGLDFTRNLRHIIDGGHLSKEVCDELEKGLDNV